MAVAVGLSGGRFYHCARRAGQGPGSCRVLEDFIGQLSIQGFPFMAKDPISFLPSLQKDRINVDIKSARAFVGSILP
jgi:hypothetical protein